MTTVTKVNPVEAFLKKVREDGQIRSQIQMLKSMKKQQAIHEIVKIADKAGFKFNAKQYEEYARSMCDRNSTGTQPITDEQLILAACCNW